MVTGQFIFPAYSKHAKQVLLLGSYGLGIGVLFAISPWLGLAAALGGLFVILAFIQPVYLCYVVVLATVFASGMNRGRLIPYLIPNEAVLILVSGLAFPIILLTKKKASGSKGALITGIIVLSIGTSVFPLLIYFARGIGLSINEIFTLIGPLQYVLIYLVFRYLPSNILEVRSILRLMLVCAAIVAVVGLLQTMRVGVVLNLLNTWYQSSHEELALQAGRISSFLRAWNTLGTFLMLNLIVLWALSAIKPTLMGSKMLFIIMLSCAAALIASGSYASMIGLVLGLLLFESLARSGRGTILIFFLISIAALAIPLQNNVLTRFTFQYRYGGLLPATLVFRFQVWQDVFWPIIQKTWLWGFRPIMPSTLEWEFTESQYITLMVRSGIFSLLAHFIWLGLTLTWLCRNTRSSNALKRSLAISMFVILIALSIMGVTNAVFTYSGVMEYVWILIGLVGAMGANHESESANHMIVGAGALNQNRFDSITESKIQITGAKP